MPIYRRGRARYRQDQQFSRPFRLNKHSPQASGILAWWSAMGSKAGQFRDYGPGKWDGKLEGGTEDPTWTNSPYGYVPEFDGDDDRFFVGSIDGSHPLSLFGVDKVTFYAKIKLPSTGDLWQRILDKSTGGDGLNGWALQWNPTGGSYGEILWSADGVSRGTRRLISDYTEVWIDLIIMTTESYGSLPDFGVYVNGVLQDAFSGSSFTFPNATADLRIGTWNHSTGREFGGAITDLRIYTRWFSEGEIGQFANPNTFWDLYGPIPRVFPVLVPLAADDRLMQTLLMGGRKVLAPRSRL